MSAVNNGAELVKRLRDSGTKDNRLAPARECLKRVRAESGKIASAAQVVAALEAAYGPNHMTVVKAKQIARTGRWERAAPAKAVAIEDELLGVTAMSNSGDSVKADAAGNKAADDREPGSGDSDPVKAEAQAGDGTPGGAEKAAAEAKARAAAEGDGRLPDDTAEPDGAEKGADGGEVTDATEPPGGQAPAKGGKVQKALHTREAKTAKHDVKKHESH